MYMVVFVLLLSRYRIRYFINIREMVLLDFTVLVM